MISTSLRFVSVFLRCVRAFCCLSEYTLSMKYVLPLFIKEIRLISLQFRISVYIVNLRNSSWLLIYVSTLGWSLLLVGVWTKRLYSGWWGAPTTSLPLADRQLGTYLIGYQGGSYRNIISYLSLCFSKIISISGFFFACSVSKSLGF